MDGRSILLWVAAGVLIGGTYSFWKQKVPVVGTVIVGVLAALALTGAILWSV